MLAALRSVELCGWTLGLREGSAGGGSVDSFRGSDNADDFVILVFDSLQPLPVSIESIRRNGNRGGFCCNSFWGSELSCPAGDDSKLFKLPRTVCSLSFLFDGKGGKVAGSYTGALILFEATSTEGVLETGVNVIPVEAVEMEEKVDAVEDTDSIELLFFKLASEGFLGGNCGLGRVEMSLGGNRGGKEGNLSWILGCLGGNRGEAPSSTPMG